MKLLKFSILFFISFFVFIGCDNTPTVIDSNNDDNTDDYSKYTIHTGITASTFWCGEGASDDNDFITNTMSAWDTKWGTHFGLEDHPTEISRDGDFIPTSSSFTGSENSYYFALPYDDMGTLVYDGSGTTQDNAAVDSYGRKENAYTKVYWSNEKSKSGWGNSISMCKNRWIKVRKNGENKWCYAQWEDAGPYYYNDVNYVFGTSSPANSSDYPYAGIDLSPSVWLYLGEKLSSWGANSQKVDWTFVDASDVPDGPWKKHVTTRQIDW